MMAKGICRPACGLAATEGRPTARVVAETRGLPLSPACSPSGSLPEGGGLRRLILSYRHSSEGCASAPHASAYRLGNGAGTMNKNRSISYYARREKLRAMLANATRQRKQQEDSRQPANENRPVTVTQVSLVDSSAGRRE